MLSIDLIDVITSKTLNYKPEGSRNIERPQTRWEYDFRDEGTGNDDDDDDDDDKCVAVSSVLELAAIYISCLCHVEV